MVKIGYMNDFSNLSESVRKITPNKCVPTCRLLGGSDPGLLRLLRGGLGPDSGPAFGDRDRDHGRGGRRGGVPALLSLEDKFMQV